VTGEVPLPVGLGVKSVVGILNKSQWIVEGVLNYLNVVDGAEAAIAVL